MGAPWLDPIAAGHPGVLFRVRAINVLVRIGALIALAPMGLVPVAWGIVATAYVNWIQSMLAARKVANLPLRAYLVALWPSLAVALIPLTCVLLSRIALSASGLAGWNLLMASSLVMGVTSILSLAIFDHPLWQEMKHLIRFGRSKL